MQCGESDDHPLATLRVFAICSWKVGSGKLERDAIVENTSMLHLHMKQSRSYLRNERNTLQRGQPLSTLNESRVTTSVAKWECAGTKILYWVRRLTPIAIPRGATLRQLCAPHMRPTYTIAQGSALQSLARKTARRRTKYEQPRFTSDGEHKDARCLHSHRLTLGNGLSALTGPGTSPFFLVHSALVIRYVQSMFRDVTHDALASQQR